MIAFVFIVFLFWHLNLPCRRAADGKPAATRERLQEYRTALITGKFDVRPNPNTIAP